MQNPIVDLELRITGLADAVRVRVGGAGERCVASVQVGSEVTTGLGATARAALVAALAPFGARRTAAVMAAPAMFSASAQLLDAGRAG
jgi:hypothetical protein